MRTRPLLVLLAVAVLAAGACGGDDGDDATASEPGGRELVGLFAVDAGACTPEGASGSTFRMVQPGGSVDAGPYVTNGDSACGDKTWTPLRPGRDGGLRTGAYQPQPDPTFDASGHSLSDAIVAPQPWFAVAFGLATNERDPQAGTATTRPTIRVDGGRLTGDLSAVAASWNGQHFNQGAPKPGGELTGTTAEVRGTFDEATGRYTLEWASQIVGGPFNNFTGVWRLEGTFTPAS